MRKKILLIAGTLAAGIFSAGAQDGPAWGRVIMAPMFDPAYKLILSQSDYIYGTSRTAAMGGAFTSLGADLSTMNINPAGLGMYQSSDWGITQSVSINSMKTTSPYMAPGTLSSGGNRTSYGLDNVAMAYNIFNRSHGLTSLTVGFGYNRAANFNSRSYVSTVGERTSIAEMFQQQLTLMYEDENHPIYPDDLKTSSYPFYNNNIYLDEWGAVLGYQTGLVNFGPGGYSMPGGLTPADSYFESVAKGGIYEYNFSIGANISNYLYLGATLGAAQINYREDNTYGEEYGGASISRMQYDQSTRITGAGFAMKVGAVVRPVKALRIGAAFHLPTYYTVEKSYTSLMSTGSSAAYDSGDPLVDEQRFNTAPRLLAGISYVIADRAILAVDYERAWYNKIRMRSSYSRDIDASKQESEALYNPANTIRAGLEILASDRISVRAGGSYLMDFMVDEYALANIPTIKSSYTISGGLGFNVGRNAYIDLTYVYNRAKYVDYDFFFYDDGTHLVSQYDVVAGVEKDRLYSQRKNMHRISLTFGSRF